MSATRRTIAAEAIFSRDLGGHGGDPRDFGEVIVLNWAHLHLLVNDVPILADVFAALFFGIAFMRDVERRTWIRAGWILLAIGSFGVFAAFFTGEPALRVIDGEPHTSGRALSQHHVRALFAIGAAGVAVIVGVVAMIQARRTGGTPRNACWRCSSS